MTSGTKMDIFKDNRKTAIQNAFYSEILKILSCSFTVIYHKNSLLFKRTTIVIIGFNLFQSMVPHFILLYFFICIPLETKLRFTRIFRKIFYKTQCCAIHCRAANISSNDCVYGLYLELQLIALQGPTHTVFDS